MLKKIEAMTITDLKGYDNLSDEAKIKLGCISAGIGNEVGEFEREIDN